MQWLDTIGLNTGWRFLLGDRPEAAAVDYDDDAFSLVTLPHDWQIDAQRDPDMEMGWSQGYYPRADIGWYRLHINALPQWRGKTVRLRFDGCQRFYDVYLNGERVGGHRYGYVPQLIDVSSALRYGEDNVLAVRVNNADTLGDRWYSGAGLHREVFLMVDEPVHIAPWGVDARYTLTGDRADMNVIVDVCNTADTPQEAELRLDMTAPDGSTVAVWTQKRMLPCGETQVDMHFVLGSVRRWDIEDPNLYKISVQVNVGDACDEVRETIGLRTFAFDGDKGFTLNERTLKLCGANLHHDGGVCFGAAVPRSVIRRRLLQLKKMGCNSIRCSHNPHDEAMYELCDELGLIMIDEIYDKWTNTNLYFDQLHEADWQQDVRAMILRDRNHPSIVLWSMGNELEVQYSDYFFAHFPVMRDYCKKLDPSRPVTVVLCGFCGGDHNDETPLDVKTDVAVRYGEMVDVFCGNYMENYYAAIHAAGMNKAIIGTEVFSYYRHAELSATSVIASSPWNDVVQNDYVVGGYVWAGVDYLGESSGYPCKGWSGCPIDSTGIWKLRAYHLYSQWAKEPVLRIGVYDAEHVPWDGANAMWGFPEMSGHWNYRYQDRIMHVGVMTNCDEVRIYQNDDYVRTGAPDPSDQLAHFYIRYRMGVLRAEGYRDGQKVIEQLLYTTSEPTKLVLRADMSESGDDGVVAVEAWILDEHDQPWTQSAPEVRFTVSGQATLLGIDNGDFMNEYDPHSDRCPVHNGHVVAWVKKLGDGAKVTAYCKGWSYELPLRP